MGSTSSAALVVPIDDDDRPVENFGGRLVVFIAAVLGIGGVYIAEEKFVMLDHVLP
jgi:hypothetical protein